MPKYSIVVPFHNEEDNVTTLYDRLKAVMEHVGESFELVFVDDGSRDRTYRLLEEIAAVDSRVLVIKLRRNFGQTSALAAGFDHAQGEFILAMDGDLQHSPDEIPNFLAKLEEGYDVVSGWRKHRQDKALTRVLPSIVANRLISWIGGVPLHDYGCSLKAYRREVLADVRLYGEMHRFIPIYASWAGARVTEIPVTHHARMFGTSKYGLGRIFKVMLDLITVKFLSSYATKPIYVFGGLGFACMLGSLGAGSWALYLKFMHIGDFVQTPLPLLTVTLAIMGVQLILMGLLAEMLMRTYHESQDKLTYTVRNTLNLDTEAGG